MKKAIMPVYVTEFVCDGLSCTDNCCEGTWTIHVDEDSFKKMRKVKDSTLEPLVRKHFKRNRSGTGKAQFGKIVHDKSNNKCAFLNEKKRCDIQEKLGAQYLCHTCMIYPRITNVINGDRIERSLSFSCPTAARLGLLSKSGMDFGEFEINIADDFFYLDSINLGSASKKRPEVIYFDELRFFSVQLLKTRGIDLWKRLIILGMFFDKIQGLVDAGNHAGIPDVVSQYISRIESGVLESYLDDLPTNSNIQMALVKSILEAKLRLGGDSSLRVIFDDALEGIQYNSERSLDENGANYNHAYQNFYVQAMSEREYTLENYLVNYVFSKFFPMTQKGGFFDSYSMLVVHFALIKMLLIGRASLKGDDFSEEDIVHVVQKFSKGIEHSPKFVAHVYDRMKQDGFLTMAYMAILIKN